MKSGRSISPFGAIFAKNMLFFCGRISRVSMKRRSILRKTNSAMSIFDALNLPEKRKASLAVWKKFATAVANTKVPEVHIAIVGKYFDTGNFVLADAYLSVIEAIKFSAAKLNRRAKITWVNSKDLEKRRLRKRLGVAQISRHHCARRVRREWHRGKIKAIQFAREHKIPYFGLCYGMQLMVIEYARNVLKLKNAHTQPRYRKTLKTQWWTSCSSRRNILLTINTAVRCASAPTRRTSRRGPSHARRIKELVEERHRHRYEINSKYVKPLEEAGTCLLGHQPRRCFDGDCRAPAHGAPLYARHTIPPRAPSASLSPHPLFTEFLRAATHKRRK